MKRGIKILVVVSVLCFVSSLSNKASAEVYPVAANPTVMEFAGGVSFDGTNYMLGVISGTTITAQRVSPSGQLIGPPVVVGSNPGFPPAAAIANGSTKALVAWSDNSLASGGTMFGQLYSSSGLIGSRFPLLATVGSHGFQSVETAASDGTNFLVIWRDRTSQNCYGQLVSGGGTLMGSEFFLFNSGGNRNVSVAFGRTNYLVGWQGSADNNTYCMTLSLSGLGSVVQLNSTPSIDINPLAVAFDGTNYLAVWNCDTDYSDEGWPLWQLHGRLVSQAGTALGSELTLVTEEASFPALTFDGDNYLLAWGYNASTPLPDKTIHAQFFDRSAKPIGPIITPFTAQGGNPPLLPMNGLYSDGTRTVLMATLGNFVVNGVGDVIGFSGGDVYAAFLPRSTMRPVFTNAAVVNGRFGGNLKLAPGQTYTMEISTNLVSWTPVGVVSSEGADILPLLDELGIESTRMFYRVAVGNTRGLINHLCFQHFANAGGLGTGMTPSISYPVQLNSYSAAFDVENETSFPPATNVFFTGPAGSGLSNSPGEPNNSNIGVSEATYQSRIISSPAVAPGGTWVVNYKGTNYTFNAADPQAASRLVLLLPTANVIGGVLQSVSWVYKNPSTGADLSGAPVYVTSVQAQFNGLNGRIYNSPDLPPSTTSHALTFSVNWSEVRSVHMTYNDSLGNHYVVTFTKP